MTADEFRGWRKRLGLSQREAAERLGLSMSTIADYEAGVQRGREKGGRPAPVPKYVALACAAVALGLREI